APAVPPQEERAHGFWRAGDYRSDRAGPRVLPQQGGARPALPHRRRRPRIRRRGRVGAGLPPRHRHGHLRAPRRGAPLRTLHRRLRRAGGDDGRDAAGGERPGGEDPPSHAGVEHLVAHQPAHAAGRAGEADPRLPGGRPARPRLPGHRPAQPARLLLGRAPGV
ncbi:MAG: hypothetical protein AVDCRST_MAG68-4983, partial [uncultured Gemmatimonadetes bacterium]